MKTCLVLLIITGMAFANGTEESLSSVEQQHEYSTDNIILTSLGTWLLTGSKTPRDIDCSDTSSELYITDYSIDKISIHNYTGTLLGQVDCPAAVPDVAGICLGSDYILINNMGSDTGIHKYQSGVWASDFTNPCPDPMGMDMDASDIIWEIGGSTNILYRFNTSGIILNQWTLSEPPTNSTATACTIFPMNGTHVVMIGGINWSDFYFYEWDGVNLTFIGSHVLPQGTNKSYGAAWCQQRNSIFWLYKDGGNFSVCEFQCIISTVVLERMTWSAIKATI